MVECLGILRGRLKSSIVVSSLWSFMDATLGKQAKITFAKSEPNAIMRYGGRSNTTCITSALYSLEPIMSQLCMWRRSVFSAFLRFYTRHPQLAMEVWDKPIHAGCFFKNKTKGTISIFQNQLHDLNWELHPGGRCVTGQGWQFTIWQITTYQFQQCLLESWEYHLLQHLRTKSNLDDLNDFSMLYSQYPRHDDPLIQGFMTKVRLGGLFPCKRTNHMYDDQEFCPFCGQEDSMYHRVYKCVGTEHIRQGSLWKEVEHFPISLLLGGLSGPPSGLQSFRQHLDSLPHPEVYKLPQTQEPRTFFTDGSAFGCGDIQALLCSWAVTEATYMSQCGQMQWTTSGQKANCLSVRASRNQCCYCLVRFCYYLCRQ